MTNYYNIFFKRSKPFANIYFYVYNKLLFVYNDSKYVYNHSLKLSIEFNRAFNKLTSLGFRFLTGPLSLNKHMD